MKVVFVGDEPSSLNISTEIAFVGTPSHTKLLKWIKKLKIIDYHLINSKEDIQLFVIQLYAREGCSMIALGNNASERLNNLKIKHFKLPHPSPRNRLLNDMTYIEKELKKCKKYLSSKATYR